LFFWQASQEAEEQRIDVTKRPLIEKHYGARREFSRIRADTITGMAFSNLIALSIIVTAAATLHAAGKTDIQTSAQAAEALRPIAALCWSAVINGVLAVPVMVLLMLMARHRNVMGSFVIGGPLYWLGWLSAAAMAVSVVAMAVGWFV